MSELLLPILAPEEVSDEFMNRAETDVSNAGAAATKVIEDVRKRGDVAVLEYTEKFDGQKLDSLLVSRGEIENAYREIDPKLLSAIKLAYKNIKKFHETCMPKELSIEISPGVEARQRVIPLARAGLYIPGGKAIYPSVMLMLATPAQVAGVDEIIACSPPQSGGKLDMATMVAADICGVTKLFKVGGVQSIAAMAYGTESIPKCDSIAGPGGPYVSAAQRLVKGDVRMDFPAGPSEGMVIADKSATPEFVAADVLSEAEHGPDSAAVLVTDSKELTEKVQRIFSDMAKKLPEKKQEYIQENIAKYSGIVLCKDMDEAINFTNDYAVEHLVVDTTDPEKTLLRLRTAGTYCLGEYSPISAGNFAVGPNAILPTGGYGRMFSGVSVDSFLKKPTVEKLSKEGLRSLRAAITTLSEFEGFPAHTNSVEVRFKEK